VCHTNGTRAPSCRHQAAQDGCWREAHTPSSVSQTHLEAPLRPRCHASHQGEADDTHLLVTQYPKSGHERFVHSRGDLGLFLGGYALDRRCDLRCIIELGAFVLPWSICLHVPLDVLHQIA